MKHFTAFSAQLFASATSMLVTVLAARALDPSAFGLFAVIVSAQMVVLGTVRSFSTDPLLYAHSSYTSGGRLAEATIVSILLSLSMGAVAGTIVALLTEPILGLVLWFCIFATTLQEHFRIALVVARRGEIALISDATALAFLVVLSSAVQHRVATLLLLWGVATAAGAALSAVALRPKFKWGSALTWARETRRPALVFALDFAITTGLAQAAVFVVAIVAGPVGAAALRGAQMLITPVVLIVRAGTTAIVPIVVRRASGGQRSNALTLCVIFAAGCTLAGVSCLTWFLVPLSWVQLLLGDSAGYALAALIPMALAVVGTAVASGAGFYLRATNRIRFATGLKLAVAPVTIVGIFVGSIFGGAPGSQVGIALGEGVRAVLAWMKCLKNPGAVSTRDANL